MRSGGLPADSWPYPYSRGRFYSVYTPLLTENLNTLRLFDTLLSQKSTFLHIMSLKEQLGNCLASRLTDHYQHPLRNSRYIWLESDKRVLHITTNDYPDDHSTARTLCQPAQEISGVLWSLRVELDENGKLPAKRVETLGGIIPLHLPVCQPCLLVAENLIEESRT